jgi:membrane protease YdiL (CAAX protease family)
MRRHPSVGWSAHPRRPAPLPVDVVVAAITFTIVWIVLFGVRRGPFPILIALAGVVMAIVSAMRTPRHQDVALVHQGILVLGVASGLLLFVVFLIFGPMARRVDVLYRGVLKAYAGFRTTNGTLVFVILLLVVVGEELLWRGFIQGRLSEEYGELRAYRLTVAGYTVAHLLTFNLALAAAALVCGAVWGWFRLRTGSVVPGVISHLVFAYWMYFIFPL